MDKDFYCEHILSMLNDTDFYITTRDDFDTETRKIINDLIHRYDTCLHEKEKDYLVNFVHKTSFFYGLPKIHKSGIIGKAIEEQNDIYVEVENPTDLKFRPIVGGPNSATQRLSHFLDLILKPLCKSVNSYIKDDFDFLSHLPRQTQHIFIVIKNKCNELMQSSDRMRKIFENHTILQSRRQPKNLKQMLTCSKFNNSNDADPVVSKCKTPRCGTCPIIIECSSYVFKNGLHFTVKANMNCKSKCVIYAIICSRCGDFYIGQTSNELRTRMTVHRQQTKTDSLRNLNVNKHVHDCAGDHFNVIPLYQLHSSDTVLLENKENQLIKILKPNLNRP